MNDTLVAKSGDTYLYRTYLTMLLSYGPDAKATWLRRLEGWQMDEDGNYIAQEKMAWSVGKDRISCMHQGGHRRDMQGQDRTLRTAVPGKGPNHSGDRIPTSQCGHQALYPNCGGQHMDALFTGQIPTKVIIGLLTNEAFDGVWQKNPFNFAHMDLHSVSRDVDGRPLLAQPWQPDFMQGLYAEFYHAVLKSTGMYPSDWSIGISANHFVCGCMLLSCTGPAIRWQLRCGLLIPQTSGHRESQSENCQGLACDHHNDSLCPVW